MLLKMKLKLCNTNLIYKSFKREDPQRESILIKRKLSWTHSLFLEISSLNVIRSLFLLYGLTKNMNMLLFWSLHTWIHTISFISLLFYWLMRKELNNIKLLLLDLLWLLTWFFRDNTRNFYLNLGNWFQSN